MTLLENADIRLKTFYKKKYVKKIQGYIRVVLTLKKCNIFIMANTNYTKYK